MVPTAVPSRILFFAKFANELGIFCPLFTFGVQKCSRTVFTSGEMFVKILQTACIIVTQFAHEGFFGIFGDFWVQKIIV
jgi:uncharacterized membrane protein